MSTTAPVFEIQRFSLHDGPGIRSLVFLKGCALHCPWCQNPESQETKPVVAFYRDRCKESFCCEEACSEQAISRTGFRIDYDRCTACGDCVDACAYDALRPIGEIYTPERLMECLLADRAYYQKSGGGVTFSGGEPLRHPRFLDEVLELCDRELIHTNLETAGVFSFKQQETLLRKFDLIYFDLKILDSALHQAHLGDGYETIANNARRLVEGSFPVEFRLPLVPGFTDTDENIEGVIERLGELGRSSIHLLAYHDMGEAKIDVIQGKQPKLNLPRYSDAQFEKMQERFEARGIQVLNRH